LSREDRGIQKWNQENGSAGAELSDIIDKSIPLYS
jgi:hypothetical protein